MSAETNRRCANGTIDIDFYLARARAHRAVVMAAMFSHAGHAVRRATWAFLASLKLARRRPMPDPGAVMLIAQAAVRRRRI